MKKGKNNVRKFTIIELLIVVSIIVYAGVVSIWQ